MPLHAVLWRTIYSWTESGSTSRSWNAFNFVVIELRLAFWKVSVLSSNYTVLSRSHQQGSHAAVPKPAI
jgi:hypothetical protein